MSLHTPLLPLADDFARTFEIVFADTDALRARVYQLRHRVFCDELGYELDNDGTFEADKYDEHSVHCLLRHRRSGMDVGCVRMVMPLASGGGLPFEAYGMRYIDRKLFDWKQIDSRRCCEISRIAVVSDFRRGAGGENAAPAGVAGMEDNRNVDSFMRARFPFIAVSLYQAAMALVLQRPCEAIFMVVAPRLQRHLQRFGVNIRQISPVFEHCGQRAVYVTSSAHIQQDVYALNSELQGLFSNVYQQLFGAPAPLPLQQSEKVS